MTSRVVSRAAAFKLRLTTPAAVVCAIGLAAETLLIAPGNVWPAANDICPVGAIESPVAAGEAVPLPKRNWRLAVGAAELLPELTAFQAKFCGIAAFVAVE